VNEWKLKYKWFIKFPGEDYTEFYPEYSDIVFNTNQVKDVFPVELLDTSLTINDNSGLFTPPLGIKSIKCAL
jgi:hypothetical protein